jgi:hypothetical protein
MFINALKNFLNKNLIDRLRADAGLMRICVKNFTQGTVVVFNPNNFNPEFWNSLSEEEKIRCYGPIGYGSHKPKFFVFLTEIKNAPGHCVLADLDDGSIQVMRHTSDFREATEDEF